VHTNSTKLIISDKVAAEKSHAGISQIFSSSGVSGPEISEFHLTDDEKEGSWDAPVNPSPWLV